MSMVSILQSKDIDWQIGFKNRTIFCLQKTNTGLMLKVGKRYSKQMDPESKQE
jgi:hypothetical protein